MAGAVFDQEGRVLIAQRPPGKHMAGGWEFPGGKLALGETPFDGLQRELREEIGIEVVTATPLIAYRHDYVERAVFLDLWHVTEFSGTPRSVEGQPLRFVEVHELDRVGLLEADRPMIPALQSLRGKLSVG
jgi:8-oxo-dGTP diphosphatase